MIHNYTIRKAEYKDIPDLSDLLTVLFSIEQDFEPNDERQQSGLKMMLNDSMNRCVMVAELGKKIVGMVTCQLLISTAEGGQVAVIEDLIVNREYQGNGIGKQLLSSIEDWAVEKGATRLQLLADKTNTPALNFYKKIGWDHTQLICLRRKH
ncbi:MAG: GNAT family N-acetyltransferase [Dehalobacter sp. 4CP]|uniref:GNAT family N-acetyltransferase n=1 Tax=Dehalobacter sp. CP TaxID=2594474 RepID=UPI0013CCCAC5|nr:GNAT family N-acetyltransferase [Dehalobacter sp.]NBJ15956.1 GNAT family N-acetyltransferase [Dehalobacter sp. 4CP]